MHSIFPKTLEILHERKSEHLRDQFGKTLQQELALPVSAESSRWFPVFLKVRGVRQDILEVAEFEYLRHSVQNDDFGSVQLESQQISLNPSLQFVELHHEQPKLHREPGLYCFCKVNDRFSEFKMGIYQALVVDILQEDCRASFDQLIAWAHAHKMGAVKSKEDWAEIIRDMLKHGILITRA